MTMTTIEEMQNDRNNFLAGHEYKSDVETSKTKEGSQVFKTIFTRDDGAKYFMQASAREDNQILYSYGMLTEEVKTCIVPRN